MPISVLFKEGSLSIYWQHKKTINAGDWTRTNTLLLRVDFESTASTIPPRRHNHLILKAEERFRIPLPTGNTLTGAEYKRERVFLLRKIHRE